MNLLKMLDRIESRGVRMYPDGDKIRVRPANALTDAERDAITSNRQLILELLRRRHAPHEALAIPPKFVKLPPFGDAPQSSDYPPANFSDDGLIEYGPWIVPTSGTMDAYKRSYKAAQTQKSGEFSEAETDAQEVAA